MPSAAFESVFSSAYTSLLAGAAISKEQAIEIESAGINRVVLDVRGHSVIVFSNDMVKLSNYVDFDTKDITTEKVCRGVLEEILENFETEEEILSAIEKTILFYRENGVAGERFADTIARVGFSKAKEAVLSDEILKRKEEILKDE